MKKLLLIFAAVAVLLGWRTADAQAVTSDQCNGSTYANTVTTCSYSSNVTAGDILLVFGSGSAGTSTGTITGCSLTWTNIKQDTTNGYVEAYATVASTGACSLTLTESATPSASMYLNGFELSGVTTPLDGSAYSTTTGGGATYNTPSITTASSGDLVIGSFAVVSNNSHGSPTVASPFTAVTITADANGLVGYDVQATAGAISAAITTTSYATLALVTVAFPSSTPAVGTPTASVAAGTYINNLPLTVALTSVTSGATLCYTTNNTAPAAATAGTCSAGTTLTNGGSITVGASQTIQVLGTKSGDTNSSIASFNYIISPTVASINGFPVGQGKGGIGNINGFPIGRTAGNVGVVNATAACANFYPVDAFITANGTTAGTAVTTTNLATGTVGTYSNWSAASTAQTFAASVTPLPANLSVNGGSLYPCQYATQSLAYNTTTAGPNVSTINFSSGSAIVTVTALFYPGVPNQSPSGSLFDSLAILGSGSGTYAVIQLQSGSSGLSCGNVYAVTIETGPSTVTHSSCTTVTPAQQIGFSLKWDASATKLASMALYTVTNGGYTWTQLGSNMTISLDATDTFGTILLGNNEAGTASGYYTKLQWVMVDYTNHVWPNIPH